jgi:hypothetical protein
MPVRGIGVRDIAEIEKVSIKKILSTPGLGQFHIDIQRRKPS